MENTINGVPTSKMDDVEVPEEVYNPMKTGNAVLDDFLSTRGGQPRATIAVWGGDPGAGKTTLGCNALSGFENNGEKTLFISSEMDAVDFKEYTMRFPEFGSFLTYFPSFEDRDIMEDLNNLIDYGFDVILLDSFLDIKDKIAEQKGITKKKAELLLVDLMKRAKGGIETDDDTVYTSWIVIQQMTKGGDLAGSKYLQHVVTSDLRLIVENEVEEERFMMFEKNRRGTAYEKLWYEIDNDTINFDEERRQREKEALEFTEEESERQDEEEFASIDDLVKVTSENESSDSDSNQDLKTVYEEASNLQEAYEIASEYGIFDGSYHLFRKQLHLQGIREYPHRNVNAPFGVES